MQTLPASVRRFRGTLKLPFPFLTWKKECYGQPNKNGPCALIQLVATFGELEVFRVSWKHNDSKHWYGRPTLSATFPAKRVLEIFEASTEADAMLTVEKQWAKHFEQYSKP